MEFKIENTKIITYPDISFNQEYRIDKMGNVWSPYRGWSLIKLSKINKGYLRAGLMTSSGRKFFMVHRLVMETFSPIENSSELQVNHKDGNKENNSLDNLEWCTNSENVIHSYKTGLQAPLRGEKANGNILKEKSVLEICELIKLGKHSLTEIGERYGVSKYTISDIKRKKSWGWLTKDYDFN
ncbi:MAG: HNH endonuclease [Caudoviricetes sp.]|nr:MAG: HNH endonuclease [Caudoviricetes sp.]